MSFKISIAFRGFRSVGEIQRVIAMESDPHALELKFQYLYYEALVTTCLSGAGK